MRIKWSARSSQRLEDIYSYHAPENIRLAVKIHNKILDEVERLSYSPYIGQILHSAQNGKYNYLSLVVKGGQYKIIYRIQNNTIHISQIWECFRDPKAMIKDIQE